MVWVEYGLRCSVLLVLAFLVAAPGATAQTPDQIHVGLTGTYDSAVLQPMDATLVALHWSVPQPYTLAQNPVARVTIDGGPVATYPATLAGTPRDYSPLTTTDETEVLPVYVATFTAPFGSTFTYQVGEGTTFSEPRTAKMLPKPTESITIVAGSKWGFDGWDRVGQRIPGAEAPQEETMRQMLNRTPDLFLMVGNMGLSTSNKPWDAFMRSTEPIQSTVLTMGVIGDVDASDNAMQFRERYSLPHIEPLTYPLPNGGTAGNREEVPNEIMYYGFSAGPVYVIALDSTGVCKPQAAAPTVAPTQPPTPPCSVGQPDPKQITWLHDTLEDLREDYPLPWIVVYVNHGPYAFADDGDHLAVKQYWQPLFDSFNVDLVIHSNEDMYQRTYPVRYGIPSTGNTSLIPAGQGPVYVMVGTANGDSVQPMGPNLPQHIVKAEPLHGFIELVADNATLQVNAWTAGGEIVDTFTLDKNLVGGASDDMPPPTRKMPFVDLTLILFAIAVLVLVSRRQGGPR